MPAAAKKSSTYPGSAPAPEMPALKRVPRRAVILLNTSTLPSSASGVSSASGSAAVSASSARGRTVKVALRPCSRRDRPLWAAPTAMKNLNSAALTPPSASTLRYTPARTPSQMRGTVGKKVGLTAARSASITSRIGLE